MIPLLNCSHSLSIKEREGIKLASRVGQRLAKYYQFPNIELEDLNTEWMDATTAQQQATIDPNSMAAKIE